MARLGLVRRGAAVKAGSGKLRLGEVWFGLAVLVRCVLVRFG